MFKNIFKNYITLIIVFFSFAHFTNASFEITEIMYDLDGTDTNREWVEVQNTGSASLDLSEWFLFSDNTKHALVPQGESLVPAGGYAVIAQNVSNFRSDWPNFGGLLFDSSWTGFSNDGESIALKDKDLNIVSPVTFTSSSGGAGDGNSLQKVSNSWTGAIPTPGIANGGSGGGDDTPDVTPPVQTDKPIAKKKEVEIPKITTNITTKNTVIAGLPFTIDATTSGYGKEPLRMGRFVWNFGDGITKVEYEHFPFEYTYQYAGEYVLTLSYYRVANGKVVDATDRLIIKVIPSEVTISSVGSATDPYVELENKGTMEIDLSGWVIQGGIHKFSIPEGTIILPDKKLKFSPKVTIFAVDDLKSITVYNGSLDVFATYPKTSKVKSSTSRASSLKVTDDSVSSTPTNVINLDNLGASVAGSSVPISTSTLALLGLAGIIIIGCISVFIIHKKNRYMGDEAIKASDITIME